MGENATHSPITRALSCLSHNVDVMVSLRALINKGPPVHHRGPFCCPGEAPYRGLSNIYP